jgi:hypothetical protein
LKPKCWRKAGNGRGNDCKHDCNNSPSHKARFSPQSQRRLVHRHAYRFHLDTGAGVVEVRTWHGQDPGDGHWGCPLRERWGLAAYQQLSPGWQQQLAFTLTVTTSYEGAAALLRQLGHRADDATLHALAQKLGARAEAQTQRRLEQPVVEATPQRAASEVGVLMLDGWQVRQRGPGWGKKKTRQSRVEWHELKTGVFYLQEQAVRKNGRGLLTDKVVVSWQGEPMALGRRLHLAACEHGLGRARQKLVVSDGAPWIWNVVQDRWKGAVEVLDFYHASQHVWTLGEAVYGEREWARAWVERQLHQLRHGRHAAALRTIAGLKAGRGEAGEVIRREQNYFAEHAARMNYRAVAQRDWPIGSGPVESACLQRQGRFKRSGQSWTPLGLRHLCALIEARQNGLWEQLWNQ